MQRFGEQYEFDSLRGRIGEMFNVNARLPAPVFNRRPDRFAWFYVSETWNGECWEAMREIAKHYGDAFIDFLRVEPNAVVPNVTPPFHYAARLPPEMSTGEYEAVWRTAPSAIPFGETISNTVVAAFAGASGGFGLWSEINSEAAVLGLYDLPGIGLPALPRGTVRWAALAEVKEWLLMTFPRHDEARPILEALEANYGQRSGSQP